LCAQEKGYRLIAAGRAKIPEGPDGQQPDTNDVITAIRKCFDSARIKTNYVICGVCGPDVATRHFKFPLLSDDEIDNAVLFEAEQVCPFDKGKFIVDYQLLDYTSDASKLSDDLEQNKGTSGILIAATPSVIGHKTQLARAASLSCVLMDVDGLALLNCFSGCEKLQQDETIAILDVGSTFANLAILSSNGLLFVRDILHAGNKIIGSIATEYNLSLQVVQDILKDPNQQHSAQLSVDSFQNACTKLITEVTETLRYYAIQEGKAVNKMLVCGGFAQTRGFVELLNSNLPLEVMLWNPLKKFSYDFEPHKMEIINQYGPSLALAAGLAMRTI